MDELDAPPTAHTRRPQRDRGELPLLRTKLYAPRLSSALIARPGLMQRLDQILHHKLTLISTPPGYGKSTLAAQWLESSNHASAWVSLDADDNDSASFFRYLVAAIEAIDPELVTKTNQIRRERSGVPVRTLVNSLATELAEATRPLLLIFDDFHLIQASDILEGIGKLVTFAPAALRIVLLTRADPRLPLMRMRAQGELFAPGPADLGFTFEETRTLLCDHYELALDESQLAFLQSWSEGWPLGLVLLGQAMREREHEQLNVIIDRFSHNPDFIAEYLWKELTLRQPADRQAFLLQTSILSQFNPRACDAVTGRNDSQSTLAALKEENLFLIPIGERGTWYRYHHLFGDVLRERLAGVFPKTEILELHRRAAHWFLAEGLIQEAGSHAIKSQDWELAIWILKPWTTGLFQRERLTSLRNVLDTVPEDVLIQDPELSFQFAWASIRTGRASKSRVYADAAEKRWVAAGDTLGIGRILVIRALEDFLFNRNQQGIERCTHALALIPEEWTDDRARVFGILGNLHTQLGDFPEAEEALLRCRLLAREIGSWSLQLVEMNASALCLMGRAELDEAETLFQRVIATGDEWQDLPVIFAHSHLASIYLDQHRLDAAEQLLERALELAERLSAHIHLVRVHCLLAELAWARHDPASALVEFERAIATGASDGFGSELRNCHAHLARFWIQQGKFNLARTWSTEINLNLDEPSDFSRSSEYLVLVELMARTGTSGRALASLAVGIPIARERSRFDHLLRMLVLRSFILRSQGRPEESRLALLEALDIGAAHGYIRPFLAFGPDLNDQLIELSRTSTHAHYIRRILDEVQHGQRLAGTGDLPSNPLSERQIEILRLVAAGLSNRDIADQLFISEQTAKKHMANIYLRLEVSSRTQAVAAANRLRLL